MFQKFEQPFTNQAWIAILITTSACFMALIIPYIFVKAYELSDAHMTAATATWLLFTLINACVRDVSWHPYMNEIVSSSWDRKIVKWTPNPPEDHLYQDLELAEPHKRFRDPI